MTVTFKKLKEIVNSVEVCVEINDETEIKIGSGNKEYPLEDIFISAFGSKIVFANESYAERKRKQKLVY